MTYSRESFVNRGKDIGSGIGIVFGALLGVAATEHQANQKTQQTTVTTTKISTNGDRDNLHISIQQDNQKSESIELPGRECHNTLDTQVTKNGNTTTVKHTVTEEKPVVVTTKQACDNLTGAIWLGYWAGAGIGMAVGFGLYYVRLSVDYTVVKPCVKMFGKSNKSELPGSNAAETISNNIEEEILPEVTSSDSQDDQLSPIGDSDEA